MGLASIIIWAGTKELAGFTVGGYLAEKIADIGTGKVWGEIKKKIGTKPDTFEFRLYSAIEESVRGYLCENVSEDIFSAVCERIFSVWCIEGYLTPEHISGILHNYSAYAKQSDILNWYHMFQVQIVKDDILYPMFVMNNMQLSEEMQKEHAKKINQVLDLLQITLKGEENTEQKYPIYLSDPSTDISTYYMPRETLENEIWNTLVLSGKSVLLFGIGGIGKTETAKSVLKKIHSLPCDVTGIYQIIWVNYINSNLKESLIEAVNDIGDNKNQEEAWGYIYDKIQTQRDKLLIVIDNVETLERDKELDCLSNLPCRVLLTSRTDKLDGLCKFPVEHLSKRECREIFYHYYIGFHNDFYLNKILELSEFHTVMLELLAKTANMEEEELPEFYERLVQNGFRLSEEKVDSSHPSLQTERRITEQLKILFTMSKCTLEEKKLLCQLSVIPALPFQYKVVKKWIEVKYKSQLEYLVKTGWLKSDKELVTTYIMHSVIASAIRFQNEDDLYEKCRYVIHSISKELKCDNLKHGSEKAYLIPFSWSISDVLRNHLCEEQDSFFLSNLANIYLDVGNFESAYQFFLRALELDIKLFGSDSEIVSDDYYNLAEANYNMYEFSRALSHLRKALLIRKKYCSSDDIQVVSIMRLLAGIYTKQDRLVRAEKIYLWTTDKLEKNPETETLLLSTHYGDMASFFRDRGFIGDYEKAEHYYQKAEIGMKQVYGNYLHPEMAAFYDAYALLYDEIGEYDKAILLLEKALHIKEKILEVEHPDIVQSLVNIGLAYYEMYDYEKSLDCLNRALEISDRIWAGPFLAKGEIYNNLGLIYKEFGNYSKAKEFYEQALEIRKSIYTSDAHIAILSTKNNLAQIYYCEENFKEAIIIYEDIIHSYKKNASDSTFLATVYDNLGCAYRGLDKYDNALDMCTKGMNIRKAVLGECSKDYARSLNNVGLIYFEKNELENAFKIWSIALDIKTVIYPIKHRQVSEGYFNLGLVCESLEKYEEALENYKISLEIDHELEAYDDASLTAEYIADIYEQMGMEDKAEVYRSIYEIDEEE